MPRLFTALAEWGACMLFLLQYPRKLNGLRFWLAAAGALVVQVLWLEGTGSLPVAFWMPAMAVAVGLMFLFLVVCGRSDLLGAGYCTVRAFLLAEFTASAGVAAVRFLREGNQNRRLYSGDCLSRCDI